MDGMANGTSYHEFTSSGHDAAKTPFHVFARERFDNKMKLHIFHEPVLNHAPVVSELTGYDSLSLRTR